MIDRRTLRAGDVLVILSCMGTEVTDRTLSAWKVLVILSPVKKESNGEDTECRESFSDFAMSGDRGDREDTAGEQYFQEWGQR